MWNPHVTRDAESMLTGNFETPFPVRLVEKDLGYTVQTGGGEASMPTVSAVRNVFRKAIDENLGNFNMTAVAKLLSGDSLRANPIEAVIASRPRDSVHHHALFHRTDAVGLKLGRQRRGVLREDLSLVLRFQQLNTGVIAVGRACLVGDEVRIR
jgi:hypothetical protein